MPLNIAGVAVQTVAGNKNKYLIAAVIFLGLSVWLALATSSGPGTKSHGSNGETPATIHSDSVTPQPKNDAPSAAAPSNVFIGHDNLRKINTIFTTRKKSVLYQALVRYEPVDVPYESVPGLKEILQYYGRQGRELPRVLKRIDQETEMTTDNLGTPLRFITGMKLYVNPLDGKVVAYDMAQTTGGQPQRMIGHVNKNGVAIEVYRGGQLADKQEVTFVRDTFIPVEYEFIHQWYELNAPTNREAKAKREQVKFSIFVPEAMAQVLLVVKPMGDAMIPVNDANYDCAHYEVLTVSTQSAEGIFARQEMWFDKESGRMMRRQDFDASMAESDAPVTDREPYQRIEQLGRLSELPVTPPPVPPKAADYLCDREFKYKVKARDQDIGQVQIRFAKYEPGKTELPFVPQKTDETPAYFSTARVRMDTGGSLRNEVAVTLYDAQWRPIHYETHGEENAGVKLDYHITARIGGEKIRVATHRDALPELKTSAAYQGALACSEIGLQFKSGDGENAWRDPLKRVPVGDDEAKAQESEAAPRLLDQSWTRAFPDGIFISDFNRVEHLALLACRLPLPPLPKKEDDPVTLAYQKAALYLVRQNRCGVLLFEVRPEPRPVLTERQKKRRTDEELNEPQLYVASASAAMMPCHMLLAPDGRILELSMKYGAGDVTYTLDDPIMRHREEAAKKKKLQEGPRLIRPPWW